MRMKRRWKYVVVVERVVGVDVTFLALLGFLEAGRVWQLQTGFGILEVAWRG